MDIDEAIKNAEDMAKLNEAEHFECAVEYKKLAMWLKELKFLRKYYDYAERKIRTETERLHGEWIEERDERGHLISRKCPFCKTYESGLVINFCHFCGADMRKEGGEK